MIFPMVLRLLHEPSLDRWLAVTGTSRAGKAKFHCHSLLRLMARPWRPGLR